MARKEEGTPRAHAEERAKYLTDVMWHVGAFVIINGMLWVLDLIGGGGVEWAFWVTIFWGIGLSFHVLAYLVDGRQVERRKTQQYLEEERWYDSQLH